ncbi:uncharacterized protein Tco025E_00163 [Trypanosoma conorhini]|uniref:Uncharacterized protein n=1 Tax=Trypanosoma conorhini TaxID=83891 RepID=A0A3R7LFW3_9TRYP|nr:uncharacterized protein Tco025E_00163 [Trypanosoma conorhini]RNF27602.1 hypothetical protein Tco025E_00163 [Trypanosoma conorhini]
MRSAPRWALCLLLGLLASAAAGAQGPGEALSRSEVNLTFDGEWTAASVQTVEFSAAVQSDVGVALGIQRAAAWFDADPAVAVDPGAVVVNFVVWSDPGTVANRLLQNAAWAATQAYYTTATTKSPASPFVTSALRAEEVTLHFTGAGWGNATAMPDAELSAEVVSDVDAVTDVTGTPSALKAVLVGGVDRTNGVSFNLEVYSAGIQNITSLLSSASTYASLLNYYKTNTNLDDGALGGVSRTPASPAVEEYRTQLQMVFSGSWQLVLLANETEVALTLRFILAAALNVDPALVVVGIIGTTAYPFNLNATVYVVHLFDFDAGNIPAAAAAAEYAALVSLYMASGGDPSVIPVLLAAEIVVAKPQTGMSAVPLISTHNIVVSGTRWQIVLPAVGEAVLDEALAADLAGLVPYGPTLVTVLRDAVSADGGLNSRVMVTQQGDVHIIPYALDAFFTLAPSLPNTAQLYDASSKSRVVESIKVVSASEVQAGEGSTCTPRCVGVSVMGGCLLALTIVAMVGFCVWRVFARYVTPKRINSDLVRIPAEQNPFVATVSMRGLSSASLSSAANFAGGALGPMYPPSTAEVAPFGPRLPTSTAAAPESRMTSYVAPAPSSSVVRQSNIIIPSAAGEKEFEIIVIPRAEYERSHSPQL